MSAAPTIAEEKLVPSVLREYGEATRSLLFQYLPDAEPRRYLYDLLPDYPRRGGRSFRPSLCIATARAFGTPIDAAIRTAVSIELMHNAMLIHDDIQDESEQRRGRPTLHATEGVPIAINVGDVLSLMSMRPLLDNRFVLGHQLSLRIIEETERMARESAEGQALELGWRRDNVTDVTEADYLEMVLKKTCWLATIHPSRVGALIGTAGTFELDRLIRFGFFLGAAFQIQDDLLNLVGDPEAYGKELSGDIREGKRTLMLIHLFEQASRRRAHPAASDARPSPHETLRRRRALGARAHGFVRLHRVRSPGGTGTGRRRPPRVHAGLCGSSRLAGQALHRGAADLGDRARLARWRRRAQSPHLPLFSDAPGGSLRIQPPFSFAGMTARVFPLRANIDSLQRFVDGHLNFIPPEVGRFRVPAPYVYLMMLDYGKLALEAANLGWLAQREIMFCVPLEWYKVVDGRWVFSDWATVAPFIYVDDDLSMGLGRTVYGWPKTLARLTPTIAAWMENPVAPVTQATVSTMVFPKLYYGRKLEEHVFLEVERTPPISTLPHPSRSREPVRAVGRRVESRRGGHRARQGCRRAAQGPRHHADERGLERSQLHGDDGSAGAVGVPAAAQPQRKHAQPQAVPAVEASRAVRLPGADQRADAAHVVQSHGHPRPGAHALR